MPRLQKVQQTTKKVFKKKQEQKTLVRRLRKLGLGRHEVTIKKAEIVKEKEHLIRLTLESLDDERKGIFIIPMDGYAMDSLVHITYGDDVEDVYLEDLEGQDVAVEIVRNKRYLNIDYFEALESHEDVDYDEEQEELELDIDFSDMESDNENLEIDYLDELMEE